MIENKTSFYKSQYVGGIYDGKIIKGMPAGVGKYSIVVSPNPLKEINEYHLYKVELNETNEGYPVINRLYAVQTESEFEYSKYIDSDLAEGDDDED